MGQTGMTDRQPAREPPVARPTIDEGEMFVISEEDAAELAAELYCWLIQYPAMDQTMSEETATHFYDLLTGNWRESLHSTS